MSFISKIKNILFEEEEVVESPTTKKESSEKMENKTIKQSEEKKANIFSFSSDDDFDIKKESPKKSEDLNTIETPKRESSFSFPMFDEEEFESFVPKSRVSTSIPKEPEKKTYEKPKDPVKRATQSSVYLRHDKPEEKKKFKPSPIISPVYGILDKDYVKEDIMPKKKDNDIQRKGELSIDAVRKKAFGTLEDEIEKTITTPKDDFFQNVEEGLEEIEVGKHAKVEPKVEPKELEIPEVVEEVPTYKKDIEELLRDSAHEEIVVADDNETTIDDIEEELGKLNEEEAKPKNTSFNDTEKKDDDLEQDLFELIDSMYDDRKGE